MKALKANIVLLVAGCVLVVLAGLWRVAIAPAIRIVAGDFDSLYFYEGTDTVAVAAPGQPALPQEVIQPIVIGRRTANRSDLTTSTVSVVEVETQVMDQRTREVLSTCKALFAMDRRTGQLVGFDKIPPRSGYFIVFPFNSPKGQVPYWSELTESTHPAVFYKEEKHDGRTFHRYRYSFGGVTLKAPPAGYPAELTGAQLKQMLGQPGLLVGDSAILKPAYTASGRGDLLVEPVMGTIASASGVDQSVSMTVEDAARDFLVTRMLYRVAYEETKSGTADGVTFAREELSKYTLQFVYIPLMLLALGIACVLVASFAGVKRYARQEGLAGPKRPADVKGETADTTGAPVEAAGVGDD